LSGYYEISDGRSLKTIPGGPGLDNMKRKLLLNERLKYLGAKVGDLPFFF